MWQARPQARYSGAMDRDEILDVFRAFEEQGKATIRFRGGVV